MKKQKKNCTAFYPQKGNDSWKQMAGATAATAFGVTASQADAITITLANNYISVTGGSDLNADLTGDGHPDVTITGVSAFRSTRNIFTSTPIYNSAAQAILNGVRARVCLRGWWSDR